MKKIQWSGRATVYTCFVAYFIQAIICNFPPLLFVFYHEQLGISWGLVTLLTTLMFLIQLVVDVLSGRIVSFLGYRGAALCATGCAAAGLLCLAFLPFTVRPAFLGVLIPTMLYSIGAGLLEVIVNPLVEGATDGKGGALSLLHSFYCWGAAGTILISVLFFRTAGIDRWPWLTLFWVSVCAVDFVLFLKVPVSVAVPAGQGMKMRELLKNKLFFLFFFLMLCAGATEQSVAQWISSFFEKELHFSKDLGDFIGPFLFLICMGVFRVIYSKLPETWNKSGYLLAMAVLCLVSYGLIAFSPWMPLTLAGFLLVGVGVAAMWPGVVSMASGAFPAGGTALFAAMALGGDIGCTGGPTVNGYLSDAASDMRMGMAGTAVFPLFLTFGFAMLFIRSRKNGKAGTDPSRKGQDV